MTRAWRETLWFGFAVVSTILVLSAYSALVVEEPMKVTVTIVDERGDPVTCRLCEATPPQNGEFGILCSRCIDNVTHDFRRFVEIVGPIGEVVSDE